MPVSLASPLLVPSLQPIHPHSPLPHPLPPVTHHHSTPQMRKVQEKIEELQTAHAAQVEAVMAQYEALLQQVGIRGEWGWG